MKIIVIIFLSLCVLHLVYECLILPTFRLKKRYQLFALRDRLRDYEIESRDKVKLNNNLMRYMYGSLNMAIQTLNFFDMALLFKVERILSKDEELRRKVKKNSELFNKYATVELKEIRQRMLVVLFETFFLNGLMLYLYLFPIAILVFLGIILKDRVQKAIDDFTDIPEGDSYQLIPARMDSCRVWDSSLDEKHS